MKKCTVLEILDHETMFVRIDLGIGVSVERPVKLFGVTVLNEQGCRETLDALPVELHVRINEDRTRKYGQLLGTFYVEGVNINDTLLEKKFVKPFTKRKTS